MSRRGSGTLVEEDVRGPGVTLPVPVPAVIHPGHQGGDGTPVIDQIDGPPWAGTRNPWSS